MEEAILMNVSTDWKIFYSSQKKRRRWLIDDTTRSPTPQQKQNSRRSRDAHPFFSGTQWMFQRKDNGIFVDVPMIFLPDLCPQVIHEWLQGGKLRRSPAAFAVTFCSRFEGARRDDVEWIIGQTKLHLEDWERCDHINRWQLGLLKTHPRRGQLLQTLVQKNNKRSGLFADTLKACLAASPPLCHGPNKTCHVVDNNTLAAALSNAQQTQTYLLLDPVWFASLPVQSSDQFVMSLPDDSTRLLDVQDLGVSRFTDGFCQMPANRFKSRWIESQGKVTSSPINLLNLSCGHLQITPPPLVTYCDLLREACDAIEDETTEVLRGKKTSKILEVDMKKGKNGIVYTDMSTSSQNCQRFVICGQAGAISGFHMDLLAPITFITLEGGDDKLKYWPIIDFDNMTEEERSIAMEEFAKEGANWMPKPEWIKTFSLTGGATIIMRPGTIHAPITATNCFARGGMVMDKRFFVSEHLFWWKYIAKNRTTVTNEEPSKQTPSLLRWIINDIQTHPAEYRITEDQIAKVIADCEEVIADSKECDCGGPCFEDKCYCHSRGLSCVLACGCNGCTKFRVSAKRRRKDSKTTRVKMRKTFED